MLEPEVVYPDLVSLAGGVDPIIDRAETYAATGDELEALRLLDVAKSTGPEGRKALTIRLGILKNMLARSVSGHDNMSETGILAAMVRQTQERLNTPAP